MNISSLSGLTGLSQQQNLQKSSSKLSAVIAALASGNKLTSASTDISSLSVAGQLQAAVSGLKQASGNLAQASSLAQVADGGLSQINEIAQQLQNLAQQARSPILNDDNRRALGEQFKQLTAQIDSIAANTSFGGKKLLNGDLNGNSAVSLDSLLSSEGSESGSLSIENFSSASLFGGSTLNLSSADDAANAFAVIGDALNKVTSGRADAGSFLQSVDYAAASIDSAIANQEAARSTLQDTDFAEASSQQSQATLQQNIALALAAQGNRLTPALLQLVG
ncbi:MAG: flagellin [Pseudomonadota bacterium]